MTVLIIDDDANKLRLISELIMDVLGDATTILKQKSYQSGLREALQSRPDIVVLDMAMPTFDVSPREKGGRTRFFAGEDILAELRRRKRQASVIVVTQFESFGEGDDVTTLEELKKRLATAFPDMYRGTVFYESAESDWRRNLTEMILTEGKDKK